MITTRKLGSNKAALVMKVFCENKQHFGFIKIEPEELAELTTLPSPSRMPLHQDVYSFRAGSWMIIIVDHNEYLQVTILNPYYPDSDNFTTSISSTNT